MIDLNKDLSKIRAANFFKNFQKPLRILSEIALLIVFTIVVYTLLLYSVKYIWILFTATQVGQTYAKIHAESYRMTNEFLNGNFISLAFNLTLTSFVICLLISAVLQFLHINRVIYSNRNIFAKIIFIGLPLTGVIAFYMYYTGEFRLIDTAFIVVLIPTLCVFTGSFKFSEEFVPELIDIVHGLKKEGKTIKVIRKEESKQRGADRQITLQDIWDSYSKHIIFILIIIVAAGVLNILSRTSYINKKYVPAAPEVPVAAAVVPLSATEQEPVAQKTDSDAMERFVAHPGKIVLDKKSSLMWAAEESETLSWDDAKKYCKKFRGGGYKDWRMPTLTELEGLYDPDKQPDCGCITNLIEMENGPNCWEWSSHTKDAEAAFFAFNLSGVQWLPKSNNSSVHIRPVRSHK